MALLRQKLLLFLFYQVQNTKVVSLDLEIHHYDMVEYHKLLYHYILQSF